MKTRILLWGTGDRSTKFIEGGIFENCEIAAIVDSYSERKTYLGYDVIRPVQIPDYLDRIDYIVICNQFYIEITEIIRSLGISMDKVIITDHSLDPVYLQSYEKTKDVLPNVYEVSKNNIMKTVKLNERDFSDPATMFKDGRFADPEYYLEYFRFRTFEFVAEEITTAGIEGAVAELGVFQGMFSALINEKFPDRTLFLFDTFEGFDVAEAEAEKNKGRCEDGFIEYYKDNSVEIALKKLPFPQKVVVCKGFFPDSITDRAREERYAFVSLDVDFEESTYQGLEFFYPRMSEGGYILIHDYNTYFLGGVKKAVERYEQKQGFHLKKVPLADRAGTLVVVK